MEAERSSLQEARLRNKWKENGNRIINYFTIQKIGGQETSCQGSNIHPVILRIVLRATTYAIAVGEV